MRFQSLSRSFTLSIKNKLINVKIRVIIKIWIQIFFIASPRWIQAPSDIISTSGGSITVMCLASGFPEPKITWIKFTGNTFTINKYDTFQINYPLENKTYIYIERVSKFINYLLLKVSFFKFWTLDSMICEHICYGKWTLRIFFLYF